MPRCIPKRHGLRARIRRGGVTLAAVSVVAALASAGPAAAQGQPGDAKFCQRYAETAATAAADAIALNPACLNPGTGVHGDQNAHFDWCSRTPSDKVEGASVHIRRLAGRCTNGALAPATEYGGYDIVGHERFERPYGQARQWEVRSAFSGRTFMYCVAVPAGSTRPVRLGMDRSMPGDGSQWQLAVPMKSGKDWEGSLQVDGKGRGNGGGATVSGTAIGGWTIAWLGMSELDGLRKGRAAVLGVGTLDYDFGLEGVAAAITKVEECQARRGVVR